MGRIVILPRTNFRASILGRVYYDFLLLWRRTCGSIVIYDTIECSRGINIDLMGADNH
jgi:hypothetical protein